MQKYSSLRFVHTFNLIQMKIKYYYDSLYPVFFLDNESLHQEQEIEIEEDLLKRYSEAMMTFQSIQKEIELLIIKQKHGK